MRVTLLGAGAWGTALALVLAARDHAVCLWTWEPAHAAALRTDRENRAFLPGFALPAALRVESELEAAVRDAELLVVVVPSHAVRETVRRAGPFVSPDAVVVCASKGLDTETLELMSEVITAELGADSGRLVALSGPSFAKEVARGVPTNVVAASTSERSALLVQEVLSREQLRVYTSQDPIGVELGGALKNVIAIAAGASDGLRLGDNTRAALITRGIAEMARMAAAKGGEALTMAGLAGIGDLVLTCTGDLSRNRTLGRKLGEGMSVEEALRTSDGVAEGYLTSRSAHLLAGRLGIEMPLCSAVYSVLHEGRSPKEAMHALLARRLRGEWG
jgi:glycerol-3-phosphate dehydrogenase (NAD(P)+)